MVDVHYFALVILLCCLLYWLVEVVLTRGFIVYVYLIDLTSQCIVVVVISINNIIISNDSIHFVITKLTPLLPLTKSSMKKTVVGVAVRVVADDGSVAFAVGHVVVCVVEFMMFLLLLFYYCYRSCWWWLCWCSCCCCCCICCCYGCCCCLPGSSCCYHLVSI